MKISSLLVALLITPSSGEFMMNGVKGTLEFTTNTCTNSESLSAQCAVGGGDLCANNKCASTTGSCNDAGDGCLDLMGNVATCEEPVNKCGDGYCGVPPVYENCQCKDNQCYEMKFVPSDGSSDASTGDADVTQTQTDGDTTDNEGDNVNAVVPQVPDDGTTTADNSGGESYIINGVKGKLQFTTNACKYGTDVQCAVASGPLCKNNMCAGTTSTCDDATGGCLSLMGKAEACNKPANICGDGYCGTPPTYSNCQCKDNKCYAMEFFPDDGSAPIMGDTPGGIQGTIIGSPGAIMVGSWLVGGVAVLAVVVGW